MGMFYFAVSEVSSFSSTSPSFSLSSRTSCVIARLILLIVKLVVVENMGLNILRGKEREIHVESTHRAICHGHNDLILPARTIARRVARLDSPHESIINLI